MYYSVMKCPKCNVNITEGTLVCPNCKKVLKLLCPKCNTINKSNTCKKCGFAIISKCHKCGKINQTINETCSKCGFSTYTSTAINSSYIDEFACLTVEFPNLKDINIALGSTKLTDKFKINLDKLILNYTHSLGVTREVIDSVYIIRFNKDTSFSMSAKNAVKAAIGIQNLITELNFKLKKMAGASLKCNIAILKRDIYSQPNQYKSGFDIRLIYQHKKDFNLLNNLQIITDAYVYEQICDKFDLSALTAKVIKNEMMTFFELNLKKYIKIPKITEEENQQAHLLKLNNLEEEITEDEEEEGDLYDIEGIDFNELKCSFSKVKSKNLIPEILDLFNQNRKKIISIKSKKELFPRTTEILDKLEQSNLFKNVFRITCYDEMKYKPYGFFHELISSIYNYAQSPKNFSNNNFEIFKALDESEFIKDLINLNERKFPHPEDVRYSLFDIFFNLFHSMSNSLIYIENFEKIDDTSYEVLQLLLEKFEEWNVSYLILGNEEFSLHKNTHFLLTNPDYIEITVKPSSFKEIILKDIKKYESILNSYYLKKISQNTKGSVLYFQHAIEYLLEKELIVVENNLLETGSFENILVPATLNELIVKRLQFLSKDQNSYKMFSMLLLIGPMIDLATVKLFQIPDELKVLQKLAAKKYIYLYNNTVYISNYNLFKENFIQSTPSMLLKELAADVLQKVFLSEVKHPVETTLYKILEQGKQEFLTWEKLSRLNASMGDFSAYLNCSVCFLKLLENHINESSQKTIEQYKMEVYENISNLLYKYTPNEIHNITQIILHNLEKTTDDKRVVDLCNKMLQGCLLGGNYSYALELVQKILSRFSGASINPKDANFNISFFLISLVKVEVMFSIGNLKDCIEAGEEILEVLTAENIKELMPENLSLKQFEDVIFDAMSFVIISKIILLESESNIEKFIEKIETNTGKLPKVFGLFSILQKISKGDIIKLPSSVKIEDDKFSKIVLNFIRAFSENKNNYKKFAANIYHAKISAKMHELSQIELVCDLLIGYSYFKLKRDKKASAIYYNVLETSTKNGLKMVTYLAWYLISVLKLEQKDYEVSFGMANNAVIQLEKDYNSSDFLLFWFRIILFKTFMNRNDKESAELCLNNAKFIKEKYGLEFNIGETL